MLRDEIVVEPKPPYTITPHLEQFSLRGRPTPCIYDEVSRTCSRIVEVRGARIAYKVVVENEGWNPLIKIRVLAGDPNLVVEVVKHVMNTEYRYPDVAQLIRVCPGIREVIERYPGLRPALNPSMWESLVKAIVNQQVTMRLALSIISRMVMRFGARLRTSSGETLYDFPSPETVLRAGITRLREVGLSTRKAKYIIGVAEAIVKRGYDLEGIAKLPPLKAVEELMQFKGVGPWTAKLAYMAYTGNLNILLLEDSAVSKGLKLAGCTEELLNEVANHAGLVSYLTAFLYESRKNSE